MKKLLILLLVAINVSCGASQKEKREMPEWIHNPYSEYNKTFYFATVGSGDTKKGAEKDAYTNISKIIQTKISSNETMQQEFLEESEKDLQSREKFTQLTNIQTEQTLKNIKIAKTYFDPKQAIHYSLAYLDRAETSMIYEKEIADNNAKINKFYHQYQNTDEKIQKFRFLKKAYSITRENEYLNTQLRIISSVGQTVDLPYNIADLESEKMSLASKIKVEIQTSGDYTQNIKAYLADAFNTIGFTVMSNSSTEADFAVRSELTITRANLNRENLVFVNWDIVVELIEKSGEENEVTFTKSGRSGQVNLQQAKRRALKEVEAVIKKDLIDFFNEKF